MAKKKQNNTKLGYMYRDASNYKTSSEVIFSGEIKSKIIIDNIIEKLEMFVPSQVGLENLQGELQAFDSEDYDDDHCWHELTCIENTDEEPTDERNVHEFLKQVIEHEFIEEKVVHPLSDKNQKQERIITFS